MEAPTTKQIRTWSKVDFAGLDYEEPAGEAEDPLDVLVARGKDYVLDVTGQTLESIPAELVTTAQEAIQRRVEQLVFKQREEEAETASDMDLIASFSAGSYSETRVNRTRATKFAGKDLNPWPHLEELLWRLMTEEKREYWEERLGGTHRPNFAVTEVDWSNGDILDHYDPYLFGA